MQNVPRVRAGTQRPFHSPICYMCVHPCLLETVRPHVFVVCSHDVFICIVGHIMAFGRLDTFNAYAVEF